MISYSSAPLPPRCRSTRNGATMVELMLAITITTILSAIVLGLYAGVFRGFFSQIGRTERISETIAAKSKFDAVFRQVGEAISWDERSMRYRTGSDTLDHQIRVDGDALLLDGSPAVTGFGRLSVKIERSDDKARCGALLWEARTRRGGWVAGGQVVRVNTL